MNIKLPRKCKSYPAPIKVYKWEEKGIFYVYSKSLKILGYGYCKMDADKSFRVQLIEFLNHVKKTYCQAPSSDFPPCQM